MYTPTETLEIVETAGENKSKKSPLKLLLLGFLAGLFIAFAALTSTIVSMNLLKNPDTFGLGKLIQGLVFSGGLIMVVLGGAELFTGNSLMLTSLIAKRISLKRLLYNWSFVYLGNFLGAAFLASCITAAGTFNLNSGILGATLWGIAETKITLDFWPAVVLGILCNILVCTAVWTAFGAKSTAGKVLAIIFPVTFFVACGFEHSIANMFYIPAGLIAGDCFTFGKLLANLIPVTLGNIIGGAIVATFYSFSLKNVKINLCTTSPKETSQPTASLKTTKKLNKTQKNQKKTQNSK